MIILKLLQFHLFIADFNLLSCEFDSFTLNYCIESFCMNKELNHSITYFTILLQLLVESLKQFILLLQ